MNDDYFSIPQPPLLPDQPDVSDLLLVQRFYAVWFFRIVEWIVDRFERDPEYGYLDTKFDVLNGRDFSADDPFRGPDSVYGWIQGRGLESMVFHAGWLSRGGSGLLKLADSEATERIEQLRDRLDRLIRALHERLGAIRKANDGRLYFRMDRSGRPIFHTHAAPVDNHVSYADMFCAKGLYAAARYLGDATGVIEAVAYLKEIETCLWSDRFTNGQYSPQRAPVANTAADREIRQQGPFMIYIGALALVAEDPNESWCIESALKTIGYILENHVQFSTESANTQLFDMWEAIDVSGPISLPLMEKGSIMSDPGHSIEFAGLAARLLRRLVDNQSPDTRQLEEIRRLQRALPQILVTNFENGYQTDVGGIIKQLDLISRSAIDDNLPWWSLPEAMRSSVEILAILETSLSPESIRDDCAAIFASCHNGLVGGYLTGGQLPMWAQTRDASGNCVDIIPACSDFDPGYHTNMSIIEALELLEA